MSVVNYADAAEGLRHFKPPVTDKFTYLNIIEKNLSPALLPTLQEVLEDVHLTSDIGWDLVEMLIKMPGSASCLETIARLGNPHEVILKVVQVMENHSKEKEDEYDEHNIEIEDDKAFVTLCGMLKILHQRLTVQRPSHFVCTSLQSVLKRYDPARAEATKAVVSLACSFLGQVRPPLPTRLSHPRLDILSQDDIPAQCAPDFEASQLLRPASNDDDLVKRLIRSFLNCVLEAYVNANSMEWASRLLEYSYPSRIVPGLPTVTQLFARRGDLRARDALVDQLVAVYKDFSISGSPTLMVDVCENFFFSEPDFWEEFYRDSKKVKPSSAGLICNLAYQIFANSLFDANYPQPTIHIFPDLVLLLKQFFGESDPQSQITNNPGTAEALVVLAVWLEGRNFAAIDTEDSVNSKSNFMEYLHLLAFMSVYHPNVRVRNAATVTAGLVFRRDPDDEDRLQILQDLLENCMFPSLKACAINWLQEDIIRAARTDAQGPFNRALCVEVLQDWLFPNMIHLNQLTTTLLIEYWAHNAQFLLQAANFAYFLDIGKRYQALLPANMAVAIRHRFVEPLLQVAKRMLTELCRDNCAAKKPLWDGSMQLDILIDALSRLSLHREQ